MICENCGLEIGTDVSHSHRSPYTPNVDSCLPKDVPCARCADLKATIEEILDRLSVSMCEQCHTLSSNVMYCRECWNKLDEQVARCAKLEAEIRKLKACLKLLGMGEK